MEARGLTGNLPAVAARLARELWATGNYEEARGLAERGRDVSVAGDLWAEAIWRQALALVEAASDNRAIAERLAREAVAIVGRSDALNIQGDAFRDLAEVLAVAGRIDESINALEQALDRHQSKKNLALVAQVQPRLEALRAAASV
jgi:tetratricopeptide (TPR) repeat protein